MLVVGEDKYKYLLVGAQMDLEFHRNSRWWDGNRDKFLDGAGVEEPSFVQRRESQPTKKLLETENLRFIPRSKYPYKCSK